MEAWGGLAWVLQGSHSQSVAQPEPDPAVLLIRPFLWAPASIPPPVHPYSPLFPQPPESVFSSLGMKSKNSILSEQSEQPKCPRITDSFLTAPSILRWVPVLVFRWNPQPRRAKNPAQSHRCEGFYPQTQQIPTPCRGLQEGQ